MHKHVVLCVLIACGVFNETSSLIDIADAVDVLRLGKDVVASVFSSWDFVHDIQKNADGQIELPFIHKAERKLLSRMAVISKQVDKVSDKIDAGTTATINTIIKEVKTSTSLELRLDQLSDLVTRMSVAAGHMRDYQNANEDLESSTLEDFATWTVSHTPRAVRGLLESIHALMVPTNKGILGRGVLGLLAESMKESTDNICLLRQSAQQILYQLYQAIALTELRGYNMMQFSWMLLKLYNKGNFTHEAFLMRKRYEERTVITADAVRKAMAQASREYWRCDPQHHEEDETYIQVTRLLQGYVENEVNMNTESTCKESCGYYKFTESHSCKQNSYCSAQPACNGKLLKCQYIDSDMWVCPADARKSNRRYEWIEYENGRHLGPVGSCTRGSTKVDSWWRWLFWHCSYCLCICDEQSFKSDRFFNLRESVSDITSNMVITGLRFVKKNRIIHLQIQEGTLRPNGNIDSAAVRWQPVDTYTTTDEGVRNGHDYHTLTWDKRSIDLDDLHAPEGHVLTGIRFRTVGSHLNMEIRVSPINFTAGVIIEPSVRSHWVSNDNTDASITLPRTKVSMYNPDIPTKTKAPSKVDSLSDQYIDFTHTDIDADAAQTTVPFLDAQEACPGTAVPLGGAGLYHKGRPGYGGFVGPKIITYDFSKHLYSEFPIIEDDVN